MEDDQHMTSFFRVDNWIPNNSEISAGLFRDFLLITKNQQTVVFEMGREIFRDQYKHTIHYINYFINFYDPHGELVSNYVEIAKLLEEQDTDLKDIDMVIAETIITPSIQEKISAFVLDELDEYRFASLYHNKKSYGFRGDVRELMHISVSLLLISPVVSYIHTINKKNNEKLKINAYAFLKPTIYRFHFGERAIQDILSMVGDIIDADVRQHGSLPTNREILRVDLVYDKIIPETLLKIPFYKNIITYIKIVIENQLRFVRARSTK